MILPSLWDTLYMALKKFENGLLCYEHQFSGFHELCFLIFRSQLVHHCVHFSFYFGCCVLKVIFIREEEIRIDGEASCGLRMKRTRETGILMDAAKLLRCSFTRLNLTYLVFQLLKLCCFKNEFLIPRIVHMWELREELIE